MTEYIARKAAVELFMGEFPDVHYPSWYAEKLKEIPVADVIEVRHGRYEMGIDEGDYEYGTCSVCGYNEYNAFGCCLPHNYCPNCGARMDGKGESDV